MKKTKIFSIFASLFVMIGVTVLYSCSKSSNNEVAPKASTTPKQNDKNVSIRDFDFYGQLHNDFLTVVKNDFAIPHNALTEQDKLEGASTFTVNYINSRSDLSSYEKQKIAESVYGLKHLWKKQDLFTYAFSSSNNGHRNGLFTSINTLYTTNAIDEWEKTTLEELSLICEKVYQQTALADELPKFIKDKRSEYATRGYTANGTYGKVSGMALAVANSSNIWWEENPDASSNPILMMNVVGDAAGFIIGVGWVRAGGGTSWGAMAWGGLGGALNGSGGHVIRACIALAFIVGGDS
ncbi:MAG: hypothetical protein EAZ95_09635 [Bacteroidetes bacterium]|nr:MAG: hypothetical protein EAZ95_09635 [Bacteroidota bacterium]